MVLIEENGEERAIIGDKNGGLEIVSLSDAFLTFSGDLGERSSLLNLHKSSITMIRYFPNDDFIASCDRNGYVNFWRRKKRKLYYSYKHHLCAVLDVVPLDSQGRYLAIDRAGRVSVLDTKNDQKLFGFLGLREHPVNAIRIGKENDNIMVAIIYQDERVHFWNIDNCHLDRQLNICAPGIEDVWLNYPSHFEMPKTSRPSMAFSLAEGLLGKVLSCRPSFAYDDPIQVIVLDMRQLVEGLRTLLTRNVTEESQSSLSKIQSILSLVMSLLLPFGISEEIDQWAHRLGFSRRRREVIPGILGANSNMAFLGPHNPEKVSIWNISGTMCATLHLALGAIFELPIDLGEEWDRLKISFNNLFNATVEGNTLALPSFSIASKYWHDLDEEIKHASRLLIVQTLSRFDQSMMQRVVLYWTPLLTANEESKVRKMNRAAIILGIVAVHRPEYLDSNLRKMLAESLMSLLMDEKRNIFRSAAIELIGKAYGVWQGQVHALSVFRILLHWLSSMSQIDDNGPVAQLVVPFENAATLDTLDAVRSTLIKLASMASDEIIPLWLGQDFVAARSIIEKWTTISILSDLVQQRPTVLCSFLTLVTETAGRLVDSGGTGSGTKQRMLAIALPLITDLLHMFPSVAYHRDTHRLAAACPLGSDHRIHLLDMRGSSTVRFLEGHTHPVTACDFSPDGRMLVSYSLGEATLRWWIVPSGLLGLLSNVFKPFRTDVVDAALTQALSDFRLEASNEGLSGSKGSNELIDPVSFRWSEKTLSIYVREDLTYIVNIPIVT